MTILNLTYNDYSNFSYNNMRAWKAASIDCEALTITPHPFGYTDQARVATWDQMREAAKGADLVQIFHSNKHLYELIKPLNRRTWVYHTGTAYRQAPKEHNDLLNGWVDRTMTDSPEFMILGAKDITYIATAIDTDAIRFSPHQNDPLVFAHYPSRPDFKGTAYIRSVMAKHPSTIFRCDETRVPHSDNLKRISECDVYIELFMPKQYHAEYGSFGVTAFEAAAMGKSVITNSLYHKYYEQAYGQSGWLHVCNTTTEFTSLIVRIVRNGIDPRRKKLVREWIEQYHSFEATGRYLMGLL